MKASDLTEETVRCDVVLESGDLGLTWYFYPDRQNADIAACGRAKEIK